MMKRYFELALLVLGALTTSCSLVVDSSSVQCRSDSDCSALGADFEKSVCNLEKKVCMKACRKNSDCLVDGPAICRQSDQTCQKLASPECVVRAEQSDLKNDNTLWFGLLSPRSGDAHMEAAAELVRWELTRVQNLPAATLGEERRPLGFISCTTEMMSLNKSMEHLLSVGVPAIVGSNSSGDVVNMLTNHTVKNGVLTLSPTAAAPNISDIPTQGLFYRMSGTDTIAVKTLAHVLRTVIEPQLRAGGPGGEKPVLAAGEQMKVAVMYKSDSLGLSNSNAAATYVTFNGKTTNQNGSSNYLVVDYGDPADINNTAPEARYAMAVTTVLNFRPHVIFVFGSTEFRNMDKEIERRWGTAVPYRPHWLVVKGLATVFTESIGTDESWARRVYGAQPYVNVTTEAYKAFDQSFRDKYPALASKVTATATPSYFDAAYVLAYAVVANGANPVTGANLAAAIRDRLTPGPGAKPFYVGFDSTFAVFKALGDGERVDLQGLTGSLDFEKNGDVPQTQEVFCMRTEAAPPTIGKVVGVKAAGMVFDPSSNAVTGAIQGCPGP